MGAVIYSALMTNRLSCSVYGTAVCFFSRRPYCASPNYINRPQIARGFRLNKVAASPGCFIRARSTHQRANTPAMRPSDDRW